MHTDHNCADLGIGGSAPEHGLKPGDLLRSELVMGGVVEVDKIHSALDPMKIRSRSDIVRIVGKALPFEHGSVEPSGELFHELLPSLGRRGFVVANPDEDRHGAKGRKLVPDKIVPGVSEVGILDYRLAA